MAEITGRFEAPGDEDWIRTTLQAGVSYRIAIDYGTVGSFSSDFGAVLSLDDPAGNPFREIRGDELFTFAQDGPAQTVLTPETGGDFFIQVKNGNRGEGETYTVTVEEQADDFADHPGTRGIVAPGGSIPGRIEVDGDDDWFRADLQAGVTYRVALDVTSGDAPLTFFGASVEDSEFPGTPGRIEFDTGVDAATQLVFTPRTTGEHVFSVSGEAADYTLSVAVQPDDFADNADTTGAIAPGGSASGTIEAAGDEDWFRAQLAADVTYRVRVSDEDGGDAPLLSAISVDDLSPFFASFGGFADAAGAGLMAGRFEIGTFGALSGTDQMVFTPRQGGEYFISVGETDFGALGDYTLTLETVADDFPDHIGTPGTIAPGGTLSGRLETADDEDFIRASLAPGVTYRVSVEGSGAEGAVPFITVLSADSAGPVPEGDPGGRIETGGFAFENFMPVQSTVFTPREGGDYFIAIEDLTGAAGIDYTVGLEAIADDFADNADTAGRVAVGGTADGRLEVEGDEDWFAVDLSGGTSYRVVVDGSAAGLSLQGDAFLVRGFEDSEFPMGGGRSELSVQRDFVGTVPRPGELVFTPREDATFFVSVTEGSAALGTGDYTVSVDVQADDFADTVDTTGFVDAGGGGGGGGGGPIRGTVGDDRIDAGTPGADVIEARTGDDVILSSGGDDTVDGGVGTDTMVYAGTSLQVMPSLAPDGTITVDTPNGTDTLTRIERIDLADGDFLYDLAIGSDALDLGYRLYSAAFARTPDEAGLRFWVGAIEDGLSLRDAALAFIGNAEFDEKFGADPTDGEFVEALYDNVLQREPDDGGRTFWLEAFSSGRLDRADMLIAFADNAENLARTRPFLDDGVFVLNDEMM